MKAIEILATGFAASLVAACSPPPQPPARPLPSSAPAQPAASNDDSQALQGRVAELEAQLQEAQNDAEKERRQRQALESTKCASNDEPAEPAPPPPPPAPPSPDPAATYSIPIDGSPFDGPRHALVTMVVASEFACPFCERATATIEQLRKDYPKELKVVYQSFVVHPQVATDAAHALCAAAKQHRVRKMKAALWQAYAAYKQDHEAAHLGRQAMLDIAARLHLSRRRFERDLDGTCQAETAAEQARLGAMGVRGTPSFFINGRFIQGAQPIESFKAIIDEELAKARAMVKAGVPLRGVYPAIVALGRHEL